MKLRKAISTTFEDWLRPDPDVEGWKWLCFTIAITPAIPLVLMYRWAFVEPERLV